MVLSCWSISCFSCLSCSTCFRCIRWYSSSILALAIASLVPTKMNGTEPSSLGADGRGSLSPSILTLTTPDLSTISWMKRPFLPIAFPTRSRGT